MGLADSAGTPWEGRHFEPNHNADDDGSAPPALIDVLQRFASQQATQADVVAEIARSRFLIPLLAHLGESDVNDDGHLVDKSQELSIVTVTAPDGRRVLPVFSSVDAMKRWNPDARPVPAEAQRVAIAAASEQTDLVVVDPTSETEFVVRRPAVWAIAQGIAFEPSFASAEVTAAFAVEDEPSVRGIRLESGDPRARLEGPELVVVVELEPGLSRGELDALLARLQDSWSHSEVVATRVDSMRVRLAAST